jgi:hypothetical protein
MIPTKTHAALDYLMGPILIVAPWLFGFSADVTATSLALIFGLAVLGMALFTNFELGVVGVLPVREHLGIDVIAGIFLAASPWLFGFASLIFWPHLVAGAMLLMLGLLTNRIPAYQASDKRANPETRARPEAEGRQSAGRR